METTKVNPVNEKLNEMISKTMENLSEQINTLLDRNGKESPLTRMIKETLVKAKDFYKKLPKPRKIHLNFLLRVVIAFSVISVIFSFKVAYSAIGIYAGFVFFNKVPFLSLIISYISEFIALMAGLMMPDKIKDVMSFFIKYFLQFALTLLFGTTIAPFYLAYRVILFFKPDGIIPST